MSVGMFWMLHLAYMAGNISPPSRVSSEGGARDLCCCHVGCIVAAVGRFVAALDTMGVRRDEEGFTPPRHVKNGV